MTPSIQHIGVVGGVDALLSQIEADPSVWNRYRSRTGPGPHKQVDDIWCRYNSIVNFDPDNPAAFNDRHDPVWYPVIESIPAVRDLCAEVMAMVDGEELGGVLITRIPPGGKVEAHVDRGWHAEAHEKFAVQLMGNDRQAFCFEDSELRPIPGDLYQFDNSKLHWVTNDSNEDRMTLIICIRRRRADHQ